MGQHVCFPHVMASDSSDDAECGGYHQSIFFQIYLLFLLDIWDTSNRIFYNSIQYSSVMSIVTACQFEIWPLFNSRVTSSPQLSKETIQQNHRCGQVRQPRVCAASVHLRYCGNWLATDITTSQALHRCNSCGIPSICTSVIMWPFQ